MELVDLRYAKTHEWIHLVGDVATIGISEFAVQQLTDLVYIDLPAVGRALSAGESFGEVESVKAVSDLYAPVAGEVIEVNTALSEDPAALSDDAYEGGWLVRLRTSDTDLSHLMDSQAYAAHCAAEGH